MGVKVRSAAVMIAVLTLLPGPSPGQQDLKLHETIFLCAESEAVAKAVESTVRGRLSIINGADAPAPSSQNGVSLLVFGSSNGKASQCASGYPGGKAVLELVSIEAELNAQRTSNRLKQMGARVAGSAHKTQYVLWDDTAAFVDWYVDLCFVDLADCTSPDGYAQLQQFLPVE